MSSPQIARPTAEPDLWKPVLLRAVLALVFGLITVFWPDITPLFRAIVTGLYFLASGLAIISLGLAVRQGLPGSVPWLWAEVGVFLLGGILVMVFQGSLSFTVLAACSLLLTGVIELFLGFRYRLRTVLGRDWLITGTVAVLAAILLALLATTSARAPIGVVGGSAVMIGVVAVLAALSYRHEGSRPAGSGEIPPLRGVE
ncbi:DUF308 domain-containing protein [Psychromicrobium sp. YIM B11713]|uniref:DUF308 domain-containing protein n=1 Tax=Psychromicrobium sp. YIM B11713 TaxID=3145233 RepID=UPI00374F79FF